MKDEKESFRYRPATQAPKNLDVEEDFFFEKKMKSIMP